MSQRSSDELPEQTITVSARRRAKHDEAKESRNQRFGEKIYGVVHEPVIPTGIIGIWDPPDYLRSRRTASHSSTVMNDGIDRRLDLRCFYTGVACYPPPARPPVGWNHDPRKEPWLGTRDHLVPARRDVPGCPIIVGKHPSTLVWSSNMVNVIFGLTPLAIKLKIRGWMKTIPYDRSDTSVEAGNNIKWLLIKLLDEFRINGRYPWSRRQDGKWWFPEISDPFMARMWKMEQEFLSLDEESRNLWISKFSWQF
jgi:hypothetical protein